MDPTVALALEALRAALAHSQGRRPSFLQLLYADGRTETFPLPTDTIDGSSSSPRADKIHRASETEDAILRVLARAEKPLKGTAIATRAGLSYSSHLREALAEMVRNGRLIRGPQGGYWPADRPLSE
jgi:hypothetical protein